MVKKKNRLRYTILVALTILGIGLFISNTFALEDLPDGVKEVGEELVIANMSGKQVASSKDGDFDVILAAEDDLFFVAKVESGFDSVEAYFGIMDRNGKMIIPYFDTREYKNEYSGTDIARNLYEAIKLCDSKYLTDVNGIHYLGSGVFAYVSGVESTFKDTTEDYAFLNGNKGIRFGIEGIDQVWNPYDWNTANSPEYFYHMFEDNDYAIVWWPYHPFVMTPEGIWDNDIQDDYDINYIAEPSQEGVVFFDNYSGIHYYDFETKTRTLIWDRPDKVNQNENLKSSTKFVGGKAIIYLWGEDGNTYYAVVDKYGNLLVSPQMEKPDISKVKIGSSKGTENTGKKTDQGMPESTLSSSDRADTYTGFDGSTISTAYVFEDSNRRELSREELVNLTQFQLLVARNEIYARHGRMFQMDALVQYFSTRDWYHPAIPTDQFNDSDLSDLELVNARLILDVEHEKGIYY